LNILTDFDASYNGTVIGIDEAGRGCLAGDVYAAAVVLNPDKPIHGLNDSKKLSPIKREKLYNKIIENCTSYAIATASVKEIEELNILNAALLAMKRAYLAMKRDEKNDINSDIVLIDGNKAPSINNCQCIIGGDAKSASIAAASILAKVARDKYMLELDKLYPEYQFAKHKSYGTKLHRELIIKYGASPIHRKSFLRKVLK